MSTRKRRALAPPSRNLSVIPGFQRHAITFSSYGQFRKVKRTSRLDNSVCWPAYVLLLNASSDLLYRDSYFTRGKGSLQRDLNCSCLHDILFLHTQPYTVDCSMGTQRNSSPEALLPRGEHNERLRSWKCRYAWTDKSQFPFSYMCPLC